MPRRQPIDSEKLVAAVRAKPLIRIDELAQQIQGTNCAIRDACYDLGLNINIGVRSPKGMGIHTRIGDYTIEDLR